jgi:hypothetical protein
MTEEQPGMHKIENALWQGVGHYVVMEHFKVRSRHALKRLCIDFGYDYAPGGAHALAQPLGDRSTGAAELQAMPSAGHSSLFEVSDRPRIKHLTQGREAVCPFVSKIVQSVTASLPRSVSLGVPVDSVQ